MKSAFKQRKERLEKRVVNDINLHQLREQIIWTMINGKGVLPARKMSILSALVSLLQAHKLLEKINSISGEHMMEINITIYKEDYITKERTVEFRDNVVVIT